MSRKSTRDCSKHLKEEVMQSLKRSKRSSTSISANTRADMDNVTITTAIATDHSVSVECRTCTTLINDQEEHLQCGGYKTLFCLPCTKVGFREYQEMCRKEYDRPLFMCYACKDEVEDDFIIENMDTVSSQQPNSPQQESPMQEPRDDDATDNDDLQKKLEDPNCPACREDVVDGQSGILCELCYTWSHQQCLHINEADYQELVSSSNPWYCVRCLSIKANKIKWGVLEGEESIREIISTTYDEISTWRKNLFILPRGKSGTDFIKELTRLIYLFIDNTKWSRLALALVSIYIPLMLQKPSSKSKARENAQYLQKLLDLWNNGALDSLVSECKEIQRWLNTYINKRKESKEKAFCRLMLLGKVGQAMKFINNDDLTLGVHPINEEIKELLEEKHPKGREVDETILLPATAPDPQPVIYEEIDADKVHIAALHLQGSGGPSLIDADGWRHLLCSKAYGKASVNLCQSVADLAKKLCREEIHSDCLTEYIACRLIPLEKGDDKFGNPGVRPIGNGEILRRLVGKVVVGNVREDIIKAAGPLQTCTGLKSGIEASIHAMKRIFEQDTTEAILLVDAENAFNNLNRQAALHNIKELCPPFYRYLSNTYQLPAKMIVSDKSGYETIYSEEGSTQGDVSAMAMYAIGVKPLVDMLGSKVDKSTCKQVWYADDSACGGALAEIREWWDELTINGPKFGYFPKPSKTVLIVKDTRLLRIAEETFAGTGITITCEGEKHLGAVIGSHEFRYDYVKAKVDNWKKDVEQLSIIAKDEPQAALSAYTKALCMRWCFVQRTIPNIGDLFQPLEDVIREKFIPAIIGKKVSDIERRMLALPIRLGGLGIQNPAETAQREYDASSEITESLVKIIVLQESDLTNYDKAHIRMVQNKHKATKEKRVQDDLADIKQQVDDDMKRTIDLACEKGSGAWLSALPIQSLGYTLNKQEFRDGICLRYGWKIPNTPSYCSCGEINNIDHTLNCKAGGYIIMRHNNVRDLEAELLKEVCKDVKIEPELLPVGNVELQGANRAEKARLDVSAVGFWSPMERTFIDVRVTHPNSPSYKNKSLEQVYTQQEREKKRKYNQRVLQVEKGSFVPLVFSTSGGMGQECIRYHKRLAEKISTKKDESYSNVMNHIRTRIRFSLLKSVVVAVRGERGRAKRQTTPISALSFNQIPDMPAYEI